MFCGIHLRAISQKCPSHAFSDHTFQIIITSPRGQWVNKLRPSDTRWWHKSESTLAQIMACCLASSSHYLNQCWLIMSKVLGHFPEGNFTGNVQGSCSWYEFENCPFEVTATSPSGQWVKRYPGIRVKWMTSLIMLRRTWWVLFLITNSIAPKCKKIML